MSFLILFGFACEFWGRIDAQLNCASPPIPITTAGTVVTNVNESGTIPGTSYAWEAWTDASATEANYSIVLYGKDNLNNPTAAFSASWDHSKDFLARTGLQMDDGKRYTEYKNIKAEYAYTRDPWRNCTKVNESCSDADCAAGDCTAADCVCGDGGVAGDYSFIGVYGWTRDPMVEYYIVDDWFGNQWQTDGTPLGRGTICYDVAIPEGGPDPCVVGSFTVDGSLYNVYHHNRTAWNIDDYGPFVQYYSVRANQRKCGTISITEHFKAWESFGLVQGTLYEAKLLLEAGGGQGSIDYSYATVTANIPDQCAPESDDHYKKPASGSCTLRPCVERRKNTINPTQPCGPGDCYWDAAATDNLLKCIDKGTPCTGDYEQKDETHTCEPKESSASSTAVGKAVLLLLTVFLLTFAL